MNETKLCFQAKKLSGLDHSSITKLLSIAKEAAMIGGKVLSQNYGKLNKIENKGRIGDLVTNADLESEKQILNYLKQQTPEIPILAEESGQTGEATSLSWCIDPLDGTTNYAHGYPFFATSIGLCFRDIPLLGAISIPFINEIYFAAPGLGAFCNDKELLVSTCTKLVDSLLVTGFAYDRQSVKDNNYAEFCWLTHKSRGVRRGGAAAVDLAFVAAGRLDAYWERGLAKWDLAAGVPLVELAGGIVSNYSKGEFDLSSGRILASTPGIFDEIKQELSKIKPLDQSSFTEKFNQNI